MRDFQAEAFFNCVEVESREILTDRGMEFQGRINKVIADGSLEHGEWETDGIIPSCAEVMTPKKPGFWDWVVGLTHS